MVSPPWAALKSFDRPKGILVTRHALPLCRCQVLFQIPEQSFVCDLSLPIGLGISRRQVDILDSILGT